MRDLNPRPLVPETNALSNWANRPILYFLPSFSITVNMEQVKRDCQIAIVAGVINLTLIHTQSQISDDPATNGLTDCR